MKFSPLILHIDHSRRGDEHVSCDLSVLEMFCQVACLYIVCTCALVVHQHIAEHIHFQSISLTFYLV